MSAANDAFVIGNYPQLCLIAWNRDHNDTITGEEALNLYERNWRLVDEKALLLRDLIERLTRDYGHGVLLV